MENTTEPQRVLVIAAHPDDPEFGCGGTTARWAAEGSEVFYLVCTRGDKGSAVADMTSERLVETRMDEQRAAGAAIGATEVNFLSLTDGELYPNLILREAIVREIRRVRPHTILTHDPTSVYSAGHINHPDHRAVGQATLDAVYPTARDRLNFPDHERFGLGPHKVKEVYLWGAPTPNTWVDVSQSVETKIAALRHHVSQVGTADELAKRIRERAQATGEPQGIPYAEAFFRIQMAR